MGILLSERRELFARRRCIERPEINHACKRAVTAQDHGIEQCSEVIRAPRINRPFTARDLFAPRTGVHNHWILSTGLETRAKRSTQATAVCKYQVSPFLRPAIESRARGGWP